MATTANINTAAALVIVAHYNKPAVMEQIDDWVITKQGKDAGGRANTAKYVNLAPKYDIPTYGAAFVALEITDPVSMERVNNIALVHT